MVVMTLHVLCLLAWQLIWTATGLTQLAGTMKANTNSVIKFNCACTDTCPNWHFEDTDEYDRDLACKPCRTCENGKPDRILKDLPDTAGCLKKPFRCVTSTENNKAAPGCEFKVLPRTNISCGCGYVALSREGINHLNLGSSCDVKCLDVRKKHTIECEWITERNRPRLYSKQTESCGWEDTTFPNEDTTTFSPSPEVTTGEPGVIMVPGSAKGLPLIVGCSVAGAVVFVILLICILRLRKLPWCQQFMGCRNKLTEVCRNQRGNPPSGPDEVNLDPVTANLIIDQPSASARIVNETQGGQLPDLSIFKSSHPYSEDKSTTEHGKMIDTPKEEDTYLMNDVTDAKQTELKEARHVPTESSPVETTYHSQTAAPEGHTNNFTSAPPAHRLSIRLNPRSDTSGSEYLDTTASSKDITCSSILPSLLTLPTSCTLELTTCRHDDGAEQGYQSESDQSAGRLSQHDTNSSSDSFTAYSSRPNPDGQTLSLEPLIPNKGKAQLPRRPKAPVEHDC